jgi:hypothetical protein
VVEEVAGFEIVGVERVREELACVQKAIGSVEHPDGDEHAEKSRRR